MFGEVAEDFSQPILSHFTTHDDVQGVLDFPFQTAAMRFAANSARDRRPADFFVDDDWYTDGDSNVYNLPTFLGNHDRGRIGMFLRNANPGATRGRAAAARQARARADVLLARQPGRLLRRRAGLHRRGRRPGRAPGHVPVAEPQYNNLSDPITGDDGAGKNDNIGSDATPMDDNFDPATRSTASSRGWPTSRAATPRCATAPSSTASPRRPRASTRSRASTARAARVRRRAQQRRAAGVRRRCRPSWPAASGRGSTATGRHGCAAAPTSRSTSRSRRCRRSSTAPRSTSRAAARRRRSRSTVPADGARPPRGARRRRRRLVLRGDVLARSATARGRTSAPTTTRRTASSTTSSDLAPGTHGRTTARSCSTTPATRARAPSARRTIAPPAITLEAPTEGQRVRGSVEVRATADAGARRLRRRVRALGERRPVHRASAPTTPRRSTRVFDDTSSLPDGARVTYRAVLTYAPGRPSRAPPARSTIVQARVTTATIHYKRATATSGVGPAPVRRRPRARRGHRRVDEPHAVRGHRRLRRAAPDPARRRHQARRLHRPRRARRPTPTSRTPTNDRFFTPLATPEIWLREGDATIYSCAAADASCVVPG